ncbi:MAG TPA: PilN domain-containing protein [Nocardioidaceae bacterium]|nr:PilN domain-containing protein [Nocardioidaceae bacterium]
MKAPRRRAVPHETIPSVNLLSPWAFDALTARRLQERFAVAAVVLVMLLGAGWAVQHLRTGHAERLLADEQKTTARLATRTKELAPVRTYVSSVLAQKQVAQEAMKDEVYLSRVMSALESATPTGAKVESITVKVTPPVEGGDANAAAAAGGTGDAGESTCPGPDPFHTRVLVGCVTLTGSAKSRDSVGRMVRNLGSDRLFVEPFISTTTTAEGDDVTFTGSVGLSTKTFSRRYADMDALLAKGTR